MGSSEISVTNQGLRLHPHSFGAEAMGWRGWTMDCYIDLIKICATYHAPVQAASSSSQLVKPLGHSFNGHSLSLSNHSLTLSLSNLKHSLTLSAISSTHLLSQQSQALTFSLSNLKHSLSLSAISSTHSLSPIYGIMPYFSWRP
jgi:hypothetical protein